jgi:hypothetical protein
LFAKRLRNFQRNIKNSFVFNNSTRHTECDEKKADEDAAVKQIAVLNFISMNE